MNTSKPGIPWFGIVLIIVGGVLLLTKLDVFDIDFSTVFWSLLMVFGLVGVGRGFADTKNGKVFWGTLVFLYGLYFLLYTSDYVDIEGYLFIPSTFLIFGIAFLMLYVNNFRNWYYLIPALFLCGTGAAFIFAELGYLYRHDVWDAVRLFWPLILILIGLAIILRKRIQTPV
ncbi:MAG: hypothetical protein HY707_04000 [Ignavibacteriae bacterium]|nr:hypothetical protein [Ignavibacteriota bacterium]